MAMLPFSLWHSFILRQLDNQYARGTPSESFLDDLVSAIAVCSLGYADGKAILADHKALKKRFNRISGRVRAPLQLSNQFIAYRGDFCDAPEHGRQDDKDKRSFVNAPWEFHVVRCLCSVYGCTLEQAWNTGVGLARCYYDVDQESKGDDSLIGEYDRILNNYISMIKEARGAGDNDAAMRLEREMQAITNARHGR